MALQLATTDALPDDLLSERQVLKRWGHLFVDKELRDARKANLIDWYDLRKGPHYTEADIAAYLARRRQQWQEQPTKEPDADSSSSENTGSTESAQAGPSIVTGMTPELEKSAADRLRKRMKSGPSSSSRNSSSRRRRTSPETPGASP